MFTDSPIANVPLILEFHTSDGLLRFPSSWSNAFPLKYITSPSLYTWLFLGELSDTVGGVDGTTDTNTLSVLLYPSESLTVRYITWSPKLKFVYITDPFPKYPSLLDVQL